MLRSEAMGNILIPLIHTLNSGFRTRTVLLAEILSSSSTRDSEAVSNKAPSPEKIGPVPLGVALPLVAGLAEFSPNRQAGNRTCLASEGISALLDMEESAATPWKTQYHTRDPRPDPDDEHL